VFRVCGKGMQTLSDGIRGSSDGRPRVGVPLGKEVEFAVLQGHKYHQVPLYWMWVGDQSTR
jgi:hypothetical protein